MVTDVAYPIEAAAQLYRDRADCENGFDELKNQWGLSGFTTQDINRCQTTARACALVYNWWSWYCRTANPAARMEAIASRPLLLAAVGRAIHSAGQTTLYLTPLHGNAALLKALIALCGCICSPRLKVRLESWVVVLKRGCTARTPDPGRCVSHAPNRCGAKPRVCEALAQPGPAAQ